MMNIRSITSQLLPGESPTVQKAETKGQVKSEQSAADRDANGQREGQQDSDRSPLSDEEFQRAKEYLESLDGVKKNNLHVLLDQSNDIRVFLIQSPEGDIVRRIPDYEMRSLLQVQDKKTGQLIDKTG